MKAMSNHHPNHAKKRANGLSFVQTNRQLNLPQLAVTLTKPSRRGTLFSNLGLSEWQQWGKVTLAFTLSIFVLLGGFHIAEQPAQAQKKKSKKVKISPEEEAYNEFIKPVETIVDELLSKTKGRKMYESAEASQLEETLHKALKLQERFSEGKDGLNPFMAPLLYKIGLLQELRDTPEEAYDMFSQVVTLYPDSIYSLRSKVRQAVLLKQLGPDNPIVKLEAEEVAKKNAASTLNATGVTGTESKP